jgi:ubiquinone/menaquinone biosynthesis C-methylase UbiE
MTEASGPSDESLVREIYTHGHAVATVRQHGQRTASEAAAFILDELRPGMRVLDVGCGPGSITRGLAERVAPGEVVGLDMSADVLQLARGEAQARGIDNLRFERGSAYELPFRDESFDVVFAHQVLQHLREPGTAVREMLRVVRSGGLVGVREVDWGTVAYWPADPWIDRFIETHMKTWRRNGGEPNMGRQLRALFNGENVTDVSVTAATWCYATPAETEEWGDSYASRILTSPMGERAVEYGFALPADLDAMASAFRSWARSADAFWTFTHVAVRARKPCTS